MRARLPTSRRHLALFGLGALVLLTGSGGSCSEQRHPPTTPELGPVEEAELPSPDLRLIVLTDLDGYLEPCGCTSRPLGGIDRMSARLAALREGDTPTLLVSAGNLLFHGAPHGSEMDRAEAQERFRAETLVEIFGRIHLDAATVGPLDFGYGTAALERLAREASLPLLAAGVRIAPAPTAEGATEEPAPPILAATAVRRVGELDVGLVGLSVLEGPDGTLPDRVEIEAPFREAGRAAVRELREAGVDVIVALVTGDRRMARQVATGIEGIDFVVHGGLDEEEVSPPTTTDGAVIVSAGRQGQHLVVADLRVRGEDGWTDASVWTRQALRAHVESQIASLEERIREWERDESVAEADLQRQRDRVSRLRREVRELTAAPRTQGKVFTARVEELGPDASRDAAITGLMSRLDRRVNDHNRTAFADWLPEPPADGQPRYVGSQACAACHAPAVQWWRETPHGRAYATLEERHKNFNLSCVGCHVTGYLRPGGSTVTHVENLEDVGCENCHGPASQHVADPEHAAVNVRRDPEASVCLGCHTPEHSDHFSFPAYRQMLIAPGHGQPASR